MIKRHGFAFWAAILAGTLIVASCSTPYEDVDQEIAETVDTGDYIIGPLDVIEVFVWRAPDVSVQVPVRPDGKISTPLVEDMVASGKTPSELARDIESELRT